MSFEPDYLFKFLLVGDSGVGKTSFVDCYIRKKKFDTEFHSTVGVDFATKSLTIKDKTAKIQLWDSAGDEKYRSISNAYIRGSNGILLFYDVTNRKSFESLSSWLMDIRLNADSNVVIMLIANKCDSSERKISTDEGLGFAKSENLLFYEISTRDSINLEDSFFALINKIIDKKSPNNSNNNTKSEKSEKSQKTPESKIISNTILLSASGLQNIRQEEPEYFTFKFGERELKLEKIFAQFLSPKVSQIHLSDPTVDFLNFEFMLTSKFPKYDEFFSDDIFDLLQKISRGYSVDVKDNQAHKLALVAMLLGNKELTGLSLELDCMNNFDTRNVQGYIEFVLSLIKYTNI